MEYKITVLSTDHSQYIKIATLKELLPCSEFNLNSFSSETSISYIEYELRLMRYHLDKDHYVEWSETPIVFKYLDNIKYYTEAKYFRRKTYGIMQTPMFEKMEQEEENIE